MNATKTKVFYIAAAGFAVQAFPDCFNATEAKKAFRHRFDIKKMPAGSIVTTDPNNGFLRRAASALDHKFLDREAAQVQA